MFDYPFISHRVFFSHTVVTLVIFFLIFGMQTGQLGFFLVGVGLTKYRLRYEPCT